MENLKHLLKEVYNSDEVEYIEYEAQQLVDKYSKLISSEVSNLTHEDLVLITYGDQIHTKGESKLQTLKNLLIGELAEEVTIVHLLPFYPYCSDDGFSVIDYTLVNDSHGEEDFVYSNTVSNSYPVDFIDYPDSC